MVKSLRYAAWERQSISFGGGYFTPAELQQAADKLEAFDEAMAVLREFRQVERFNGWHDKYKAATTRANALLDKFGM